MIENKVLVGMVLIALIGSTFAFFGQRMNREDVSEQTQFEMMRALQTGDYSTAKSLQTEYGIGPHWLVNADNELIELKTEMYKMIEQKDYETASKLKEQIQQKMQTIAKESGFEKRTNGQMKNNDSSNNEFAKRENKINGQCENENCTLRMNRKMFRPLEVDAE
jgi:hypothetical protein